MEVIRRCTVCKLAFPVDGYRYNAQIWTSTDGGATFWYCGQGNFFKTREEAEAYAAGI